MADWQENLVPTTTLRISTQVGQQPITLHLLPHLIISEHSLQSLLSVALGVPHRSGVTIVGLAVRIASVAPAAVTTRRGGSEDTDAIVVPLSSLANTPEYFGTNAQQALWLALYESEDYDGYYYKDQHGSPIAAGNTSSAAEGRGRPMSAASSDRSSGGQRLRPVRTEGRGRPLSAVPGDKKKHNQRPSTAVGLHRRQQPQPQHLRPGTAPPSTRQRFMSAEVMPIQRQAWAEDEQDVEEGEEETGEFSSAYTDSITSTISSMRSMAVQLSAYGSGASASDEEDSDSSSEMLDTSDDGYMYDSEKDMEMEEERTFTTNSMPFFDTEGSIGVSAWTNDFPGGERRPRLTGLGPL